MAIIIDNKKETYEEFIKNMVSNQVKIIKGGDQYKSEKKKNNIQAMNYFLDPDEKMKIKVCPEPSTFLKEITNKDSSTERKKAFEEYISKLDIIEEKKPSNDIWFNKTSNGINIRLGNFEKDIGNQEPATLGDDCVHGVIVGRTGAGKSVLINNIILNLTAEYSPWELDLYLIDMKKVELSRYMADGDETNDYTGVEGNKGRYITPHVSACGATSEVRYVVSMIQYLCDCMKARQNLFAALGAQKIKDFREEYSVQGVDFVLPRILLLVDEFQQMFLEASGRERRILDECITAITKLGRATGVHLLFASQEMSGALGSKELANFKLRIALPCDAAVSEQILGNSAAAKVEEKGITLVNKKGGSKADDNILYQTPFINDKSDKADEDSEFKRCLKEIYKTGLKSKFSKVQKFYQEDAQEKMQEISLIKNKPIIKEQVHVLLNSNPALVDAVILGTGVLYTNKKNDFESFFIEKGKKRNIGILCTKYVDIGNTLKTLVENFKFGAVMYKHIVIYESEILRSVYPELINELGDTGHIVKEMNYNEYFEDTSRNLDKILTKIDYSRNSKDVFIEFICSHINLIGKNKIEQYIPQDLRKYFVEKTFISQVEKILSNQGELKKETLVEDVLTYLKEKYTKLMSKLESLKVKTDDEDEYSKLNKQQVDSDIYSEIMLISVLLRVIVQFDCTNKYKDQVLVEKYNILQNCLEKGEYIGPVSIVWIIGTDNIDKSEDKNLTKIMENCTNYKEIYILAGANPENLEMAFRCCNYMFINSSNEKLYTKFNINFTKKSDDNKTMDFKIINYNQERSYKQFSFEHRINNAPELNFEEI